MLGSRNLRFNFRNGAEPPFYLPFRHAPELFALRVRVVFPSSEDWMLHYSDHASSGLRDPGKYFSEDDESRFEDDPAQQLRALRSKNPVIAMQQHLKLFSKIESAFRKRALDASAAPLSERAQAWRSNVAGPLKTFADVLARDCQFDETPLSAIFKLGELLLLVQSLETEHACEDLPSLAEHIRQLLPATVTDSVANGYLQFVLSKAQA